MLDIGEKSGLLPYCLPDTVDSGVADRFVRYFFVGVTDPYSHCLFLGISAVYAGLLVPLLCGYRRRLWPGSEAGFLAGFLVVIARFVLLGGLALVGGSGRACAPNLSQTPTDYSQLVCFGQNGEGDSFYYLDYRGSHEEPSVILQEEGAWRRVAPSFEEFIRLFEPARAPA